MATYWEKLKDPKWQKKRLEILNRDDWKCKLCGNAEETLHVHHGYYEKNRDPWEYEDKTMHTLCECCHEMVQDRLRDIHYEIAKLEPLTLDYLLSILGEMRTIRHAEGYEALASADAIVWWLGEWAQRQALFADLGIYTYANAASRSFESDVTLGMGVSI